MFPDAEAAAKEPSPIAQSDPKPLDLEDPDGKPQFSSADLQSKPSKLGSAELTLSYLCDTSRPRAHEKDPLAGAGAGDLMASVEKSRAKGKEVAAESQADDEPKWVERDFLQLNGGLGPSQAPPSKREVPEGLEGAEGREKKTKIEALNLSLSPPDLSLSLDSSNPLPPNARNPAPMPNPVAPVAPPKKTYSSNTRATNYEDYGMSLSYSYSVPFSHNPSCSLTRHSTENFDNEQSWYCGGGEGTNGSVHSRFRPAADGVTVTFASNNRELGGGGGSVHRAANSSDNVSFYPSELPAKHGKASDRMSFGSGRNGNGMVGRPDRILREMVSESVSVMSQVFQEIASDTLEAVKEGLRNLIENTDKKEEIASLQRRLELRSDFTSETLSRAHKAHLEILVALKTGLVDYLNGKCRLSNTELVEVFLLSRCRNLNCKAALPVDDCDCKICSTKKGFCSACMCPICSKFDCAANTCSWVGCDVCSHWCHAICGLQKNLIRPGPSLKGAVGTTEMQFHCVGCGHASEMFGFVKEVFTCCGKDWGLETLIKELDCVRKIFRGSEDLDGKGLHSKAEEMLTLLGKKHISPLDACNAMLQFFKYGSTEHSVTGSSSKGILAAQPILGNDIRTLPSAAVVTSSKDMITLKSPAFVMEARKPEPKLISLEQQHPVGPLKEATAEGIQSLETLVRFKEAEAKLFQRLADDARREVESYSQIVRSKSEKLEEEYVARLARLCLQETEERRRKKLEELKFLESSHCDYLKLKMRMQADIAGLLERMEATRKQWA